MRFILYLFLALLPALFLLPATGVAADDLIPAVTFPDKPPPQDFFVDEARLLKPAEQRTIDNVALTLLAEKSVPLFVVTIDSLSAHHAADLGIDGYAKALFDHWGIGTPERNDGILLLVSAGDRKARIELGRGLYHNDFRFEHTTDKIMMSLIVPAFKRGAFSAGIADGVRGLDAAVRGQQLPAPTKPWWYWPFYGFGFLCLALALYNLLTRKKFGWAWFLIAGTGTAITWLFFDSRDSVEGTAGSASVGSSGGFGGGDSGGGSTGSW